MPRRPRLVVSLLTVVGCPTAPRALPWTSVDVLTSPALADADMCAAGYIFDPATTLCVQCSPGFFSNVTTAMVSTSKCLQCSVVGITKYAPVSGAKTCASCPVNQVATSDSTSCGKCTCLGTGGEPTRGFLARRPHGPLLHAPPTALCTTPLAMHRHACQCAFFVISRTLVPVNRPPRSVRGWNRQVLCILHGRHLLPWRRLVRQSNCLPAVFDWPSIAAQIHRGGQLHIVHGPHNSRCR